MKFVEEVVVEEFLPTFRSMLADRLRDRGLTQRAVADALGISQSAVSKYVHGEVTRNAQVEQDRRVRETADDIAAGLASGEMSRLEALVEAEALVYRLEGDLLADLHERAMPELADQGPIRVHDPDGDLRARERVRTDLRRGLERLRAGDVADLLPDVGSNLVACPPDAVGIEDVAGVPGRIVEVRGRVTVPAEPAFGASEHVASVLLAARATRREHGDGGGRDQDADDRDADGRDADDGGRRNASDPGPRAAANVRHDPSVVQSLSRVGGVVAAAVDVDADADLGAAVAATVADDPGANVLYHEGAHGVEPMVYVLGPDVETVVDRIREVRR